MSKELLSAAGIALTLAIFLPYALSVHRGRTRPHVFSWVIWALGTFVVFLAQLAGGAGIGAWPIGVSGLITMAIAVLAWRRRADLEITRGDRLFFAAALAALPCWLLTSDPLWAVVILTGVDLAGFGPTFRKAWQRPCEEPLWFYALGAVRNLLVLLALERCSATTALFPAAVGLACVALVILLAWRRRGPPAGPGARTFRT
ncbi:hypothetical protein C3942_04430 [Solimonas fluminis]|uniref:Uncharacterized protein n=1 Tax=Solimonas fluminis TaxID=2086571 RepID=A0A2S5TIX1_9GAMM|nr:hypothetical protein [Solimonas fluminis]PPE74930.1 hypothetical protein C3942_04430 [Solimonas fluminis]